jgi:formate dehydrogenase assembly factor FdhD
MKVVINASHHIEVLTKGPNPEVGKDEENTVTNGCSSCGRGSAQEKNKKCAKWQPSMVYVIWYIPPNGH